MKQVVKDFNASQSKYKVKIQAFPQGSYNDSVVAAASRSFVSSIASSGVKG